MMIFSQQQNMNNPFETTKSVVENARFADNLVSNDEKYTSILIQNLAKTVKNLLLLILLKSFAFKNSISEELLLSYRLLTVWKNL